MCISYEMFGCISWFYVKHALYWAILLLYWAILLLVHTTIQWAILPIQWANSMGHSYDSSMAVLGHPTHPMGQFNWPFIRQSNGCIGPSYPSNGPIQWAILPIQWANSMGHSYDSPMAVLGHPTSFSYDNGRSAIVIGHLELRVQPN